MNRRDILKSIVGLTTAPLVAAGILKPPEDLWMHTGLIPDEFFKNRPMYIYVRSQSMAHYGDAAFWVDRDNYVVATSNCLNSLDELDLAGTYINRVSAGNYTNIRILSPIT